MPDPGPYKYRYSCIHLIAATRACWSLSFLDDCLLLFLAKGFLGAGLLSTSLAQAVKRLLLHGVILLKEPVHMGHHMSAMHDNSGKDGCDSGSGMTGKAVFTTMLKNACKTRKTSRKCGQPAEVFSASPFLSLSSRAKLQSVQVGLHASCSAQHSYILTRRAMDKLHLLAVLSMS